MEFIRKYVDIYYHIIYNTICKRFLKSEIFRFIFLSTMWQRYHNFHQQCGNVAMLFLGGMIVL